MILHLIISLEITLLIEILISIIIGIRDLNDIKKIIFINIVTNLSANIIVYSLNRVFSYNALYYILVPIFEVIIVMVEGLYFKKLSYKKMNNYLISILLNAFSYGSGLVLTLLF